jgi:hypothetical protein
MPDGRKPEPGGLESVRLEGYFMQLILALACLLYLARGPIGDRALFATPRSDRMKNIILDFFLSWSTCAAGVKIQRKARNTPKQSNAYSRNSE